MKKNGIACGGNWVVDRIKVIDAWPRLGTIVNIVSEMKGTGGAPYNVLINLAKMGANFPLTALGIIGNDEDGDYIIGDCEKSKIDSKLLIRSENKNTSYTDVMVLKDSGVRTFFHYRGANSCFSPEMIPYEKLNCKIFHLGYLLLLDSMDIKDKSYGTASAKALALLQKHGIKTSVDVVSSCQSDFQEFVLPCLPYVNYLIINEYEAEMITDVRIYLKDSINLPNVKKSAKKLLESGVQNCVIIHFPEGAFYSDRDGREIFQPSLIVPKDYLKSTVGAGDAFCAGILYAMHENLSPEDALKLAVATATACLNGYSCTESIGSIEENLKLFERFQTRPLKFFAHS